VCGEREQHQPYLVMLAGRASAEQHRSRGQDRSVMKAGADLVSQERGEKVFLRDAPLRGFPTVPELRQQRKKQPLRDAIEWMRGKGIVIQPLECRLVESRYR
jgi:hypothetical protein